MYDGRGSSLPDESIRFGSRLRRFPKPAGTCRCLPDLVIGHDLPVTAHDGGRPVASIRQDDRVYDLSAKKTPPPTKIQRTRVILEVAELLLNHLPMTTLTVHCTPPSWNGNTFRIFPRCPIRVARRMPEIRFHNLCH